MKRKCCKTGKCDCLCLLIAGALLVSMFALLIHEAYGGPGSEAHAEPVHNDAEVLAMDFSNEKENPAAFISSSNEHAFSAPQKLFL